MKEGFFGIWSIWKFPLARETRIGFLLAMAAIDIVIVAPLYLITNHLMAWRGVTVFDPTTSIDLAIPFIAWTVIIYQSLFYFFYPLPLFSMPDTKKARHEALVLSQALIVLAFVSNLWFILCPGEVHIRSQAKDAIETMHPIFVSMFEGLWFMDSPYNSWPSLHVSTAGLFTLFAIRWWKEQPIKQWAVGIWWILMCLSILTTKQHFILDLFTGALIVWPLWKWQVQPSLDRLEARTIEEVSS
ncbi:MAG: phosphatase PAP2 family protein [Candidatus Thermoplasmatota archaeon]|nr:phosphatase PAP2 family protein [Candidatus Thermoplasmatota archaeon]